MIYTKDQRFRKKLSIYKTAIYTYLFPNLNERKSLDLIPNESFSYSPVGSMVDTSWFNTCVSLFSGEEDVILR